jgi:hypothetical protein
VQSAGVVARVNSNTGVIVVNMQGQRSPNEAFAAATHAASHATGGTDALAPSDIGAQSIFVTESLSLTTSAEVTLTAARAKILNIVNFSGSDVDVVLPQTGNQVGDTFVFNWGTGGNQVLVRPTSGGSPVTSVTSGQQKRVIRAASSWDVVNVDTHFHNADQITGGTLDIARVPVGTGSTQVAAGNHTHVVADVTGAAASGSITTSGLTQSTARILGRTTASTGAIEEIQIGSGLSLSAGELSATGGSGGGEVRSDFVSPYTYTGLADAGTSESTASWLIRRSEFDAGGSFVATLTASAVEWDDRLTASYA